MKQVHVIIGNRWWGFRFALGWLCMEQRLRSLRTGYDSSPMLWIAKAWTNLCFPLPGSYGIVEVALNMWTLFGPLSDTFPKHQLVAHNPVQTPEPVILDVG